MKEQHRNRVPLFGEDGWKLVECDVTALFRALCDGARAVANHCHESHPEMLAKSDYHTILQGAFQALTEVAI